MEQEILIARVGQDEQRVLQSWLDDAAQWGVDVNDHRSIGRAYDEYVAAVRATDPEDRDDPTPVCTMIGMAMGEYLVRNSRLQWRVVTDHEGTDLALSTPEENAVLYPSDPVADAWEQQKVQWLPDWVDQLIAGMQQPS